MGFRRIEETHDSGNPVSGSIACKISNSKGIANNVVCEEVSLNDLEKANGDVEKAKAECIRGEGGEFLNSCPSGYITTCSKGITKIYIYFAIPANMTCEDYAF